MGMGLGWDDRLSMLYRTIILVVGRNARVEYHPGGVMVMSIRRVLLLRDELGIDRWSRLLGDREVRYRIPGCQR
jgi:hypothetical protein